MHFFFDLFHAFPWLFPVLIVLSFVFAGLEVRSYLESYNSEDKQ